MTDDLYERYKEALRVGHVAVLRGALQEASDAYRTAALIAPSRALPHTSLGGVLLRLGHLEEALAEFSAAVALAPHDEGALLGQAEALTAAGQQVDAAASLDHVSEVQESAGRLPEAADTLRRAMELEDSAERSRRQRGLLRQIRLSAGDQAAEQLLARALRLRDEPVPGNVDAERSQPVDAPARDWSVQVEPDNESVPVPQAVAEWDKPMSLGSPAQVSAVVAHGADAESDEIGRGSDVDDGRIVVEEPERAAIASWQTPDFAPSVTPDPIELAAALEVATAAALAGSVGGFADGGLVTPTLGAGEGRHQLTGDELLAAAEAAELSGDLSTLRSLLVWTARAYAHEGRFEAGLDAAHRLLQRAPSDVDAHLVLVELYAARDWNTLAIEKLVLLGRLAELNDDHETHSRLCAVAGRTFPKDERLNALCA